VRKREKGIERMREREKERESRMRETERENEEEEVHVARGGRYATQKRRNEIECLCKKRSWRRSRCRQRNQGTRERKEDRSKVMKERYESYERSHKRGRRIEERRGPSTDKRGSIGKKGACVK
jgi:hypothetical protein